MYFSLRETLYLAYVFHGITAMLFQLATNGLFYQFELYENLALFNSMSWILAQLMILAIISFSMLYFETKKNLPVLHRVLLFFAGAALLMFVLFCYSIFDPALIEKVRSYTKPISLLIVLFCFIVAIVAFYKRLVGALFYLFGHGFFLLTLLYQQSGGTFNIEINFAQQYGTTVGILVEIIFFSLGLSQKIRSLKKEKEHSDNLLMIDSGFSTVGRLLGAMTHQLKSPVALIGTLVTELEALIWSKNIQDIQIIKLKEKMRESIDFAKESTQEFTAYYQNQSAPKHFNTTKALHSVLDIVNIKLHDKKTEIHLHADETIEITSNKNAFLNLALILIDNAIEVFAVRGIENGIIELRLTYKEKILTFEVVDNGGGITIKPIEKVFEAFVSNTNGGTGMGLSIASYLVSNRLNGSIKVLNTAQGACFRVEIPDQSEALKRL
jgi:signal transduction histidine kinase